MTAAEAVASLVPLIGGGGIGTIIVAYLAYKGEVAKGKGRTDGLAASAAVLPAASAAVNGGLKSADAELVANAMSQIASSIGRVALVLEFRLHKEGLKDEFEDFVTDREMDAIREAFRAEQRAARGRADPG